MTIMTDQEAAEGFKRELTRIRNYRGWRNRRETDFMCSELNEQLAMVRENVTDPALGIRLLTSLFKADARIANHSDDSNGTLGYTYRTVATDVFAHFATQWTEKSKLRKLLLKLVLENDFGLRDGLIERTSLILPPDQAGKLLTTLRDSITEADTERDRWWLLYLAGSVARQLGEAEVFEELTLARWHGNPALAHMEIGEYYLERHLAEKALAWLERVELNGPAQADKYDKLLLDTYAELDRVENMEIVAWRMFRRSRNDLTLDYLIGILGEARREQILEAEADLILGTGRFRLEDLNFLLSMNLDFEASAYLLAHPDGLDGGWYVYVLPLARAFEERGWPLEASIAYRALLDDILARAQTSTYGYGVRYLLKLERLADDVDDWMAQPSHVDYFERIRLLHGRKSSFWGRFEKARG